MEQGLRIIGALKRIAQVEGWNAGCVVMVWAGLRRVVKREAQRTKAYLSG